MKIRFIRFIKDIIFYSLGSINTKLVAHIMYLEAHHKIMKLRHPINLDEKINWMKFNSDTSLWSRLADKYEVRNFIKAKGLGDTLNTVYGVFDSPDEVDIHFLPSQFVIKTTNGSSGMQVMIVKDKSKLEWGKVQFTLTEWLSHTPSFTIAEPHYAKIKPRLLFEKLLTDSRSEKSLIDYKFHCFDGHVESCLVCADRVNGHAVKSIYDLNWNQHPELVVDKYKNSPLIPRPVSLDLMIEFSKILSKGFPYVRVDWYEVDGKPVFSEMTFTPAGGYNKTLTMSYLAQLGKLFHLPK